MAGGLRCLLGAEVQRDGDDGQDADVPADGKRSSEGDWRTTDADGLVVV